MTISSTTRKAGPFDGNGVTTSFPFTFKVFTKSDLEVVRTMPSGIEQTLVLDSDYSVTLNGDQDANPGGTITYPISGDPLPDGWRLTAVGDIDNLQPTDITNGGGFYPQVIENALDRVTMLIQQLDEEVDRTIRIAVSDDSTEGLELPAQDGRATRILGFDADGNFTTYERATATVQTTYRQFTATAGQTSFTLPNSYTPGANSLYVWLNGAKLISGTHFTETTATSFTLTTGAQAGDSIEAIAGVPLANGTVADATQISYTPSGGGAVARTVQDKLRDAVSVKDFGAVGDGVTNDTAAINAAASACRASGSALHIPAVSTFYLISDTIDFSDIKIIYGEGGELRGEFSGKPAAIIGGTSTGFRGAYIYLQVRNTFDKSNVAGTHGIKCLNFSNSRFTLYARGFLNGLYFDGASGSNRVWVDNRIDVLELYNNTNQVHFDMAGSSYAVKNQFVGGSYYLGTRLPVANSGTFKLSLAGSGLVSDILVQSPEIGIDNASIDVASHGVFVYADVGTTWDINTIEFVDTRYEGYGSWGSNSPYAVNIATNASGRLGVSVEFSGSVGGSASQTQFFVSQPTSKLNRIRLSSKAARPQGASVVYPQTIIPNEVVPYQTVGRCYVPGRVIYDQTTGYNVPVDFFSTAFGSNSNNRANGDGDIICGSTTDSYGLIYAKTVNEVLFLQLHKPQQVAVVCFDASGNVLSGTTPWYAQGESLRSVTRGAVTIYEFNGNWLWLHKDVASFYIGAACWNNPGKLQDVCFDVLYGRPINKLNATKMSPRNNVANDLPAQTFMPLGAEMTGTSTNGWRNTFYLRTTTSAGASSGATAIDLTTVTNITVGDTIGIELDTEIATGLRRYQYTTVSSVVGSTVNLGAALAAGVASGRTVLVNRWVAK